MEMEKNFKKLSRADRFDIQILGKITLERDNEEGELESYICNTINISLSGALVETGSPIPVGSLLKYSFCMPGFNIPVNIIGEVVRGERDMPQAAIQPEKVHKALNRYGIIFLDMKDEDKLSLKNYLVQKRKKPKEIIKPDEPELTD